MLRVMKRFWYRDKYVKMNITLYLNILNISEIHEMHIWVAACFYIYASGHKFGETRVTESAPEPCVIFTMKWLFSAAENVQLCYMLLFWIDYVINSFRVALGTEMRQQQILLAYKKAAR